MKLMLRPEWRLWPLASFFGLIDLKTGVSIALLFALLNKVAGVYGLVAVLTGAGGSFAQLSLYIYSVIALVALAWGLRAVKDVCLSFFLFFFSHFSHFSSHRRIPNKRYTLHISFSQTMFSPQHGLSFLP